MAKIEIPNVNNSSKPWPLLENSTFVLDLYVNALNKERVM